MDENLVTVRHAPEPRDVSGLPMVSPKADPAETPLGVEVFDGSRVLRRVGEDIPEWSRVTVDMEGTVEIVVSGPDGVRCLAGYVNPARALREALDLAGQLGARLEVQL